MKKKLIIGGIILVLLIVSIILYSRFIGVKGLNVKEYNVINNTIPSSFNGFKIVHFSDLHYGNTTNLKDLKKLVKRINEYNPDIVLFSGDLLGNEKINDEELINELNNIKFNIGAYYVTGLHDNDETISILNKTSFVKIDDSNELIYYQGNEPINLIGLINSYDNTLPYYSITLTNSPTNIKKVNSNLILTGSTHGGQIKLPFIGGIIREEKHDYYRDDMYTLGAKTMYISNGLGSNKFKFRLFNHPSINVYRLYNN